ncbi:Alpha/beta hydrolase fold-3 [Cynara cardunculus var. scolymus]|uniref:Alpha/beta hydrolase fold-3 n=2 Tax=Cynara cardunculus var. scolymus TaxID=59895 RepID=A0A124SD34_CYNCS|nr:Alpha/beta hydrolase fold-3 [Cynara cardunculus var. scolymus]
MPSVSVKFYSLLHKFILKRQLQTLTETHTKSPNYFGVVSRPDESVVPANPSFSQDGVATKDIHIDPLTSLSLRIFLPDSVLADSRGLKHGDGVYGGYAPILRDNLRKLPVIVQFHGGGFVTGSSDSLGNDLFCRRIAKACDAIVVAVGYRLAPESKYPAAFDDGVEALNWLAKQANLAECRISGGVDLRRGQIVDGFGSSMIEPWIAAHADLSRCVLLGVSSGSNIANYVTQRAVEAGNLLDPVRVVAQVLMYPFVIGSTPTKSEIMLANSYLYDRTMAILAWKLLLPDDQFNLDHPAANPLLSATKVPLKHMPPTLTIVAEHDWMRDRAIAYSQELRKVNVDAPVYDYKDAVHEFATFEMFLKTPKAQACAEDIAIWVKKYISLRGLEFSY